MVCNEWAIVPSELVVTVGYDRVTQKASIWEPIAATPWGVRAAELNSCPA